MALTKETAERLRDANDSMLAAEQGLAMSSYNSAQTQDPPQAVIDYVHARAARTKAYNDALAEMDLSADEAADEFQQIQDEAHDGEDL